MISRGLRSSRVEMNSMSKLKGREMASRPEKLVTTTSSGPSGPLVMRIKRLDWFKAILLSRPLAPAARAHSRNGRHAHSTCRVDARYERRQPAAAETSLGQIGQKQDDS